MESVRMMPWKELVAEGRYAEAADGARIAMLEAEREHGRESAEFATASNDLGMVLTFAGDHETAAQCFRDAGATEFPGNEQATRDRLSYLLNYGNALARLEDYEGAEAVLARSALERRLHYGEQHPGHATGLLALAELANRRQWFGDALELSRAAVDIFWGAGDRSVAAAMAVRGAAIKNLALEDEVAFAEFERMPDEIVESVAEEAFTRLAASPADGSRRLLTELASALESKLGGEHPATLQAFVEIANLERELGDHGARVAMIRRVIDAFEKRGEPERAVEGLMGLALAQSDAGDGELAEATYREAITRAQLLSPALESRALRNAGVHYVENERGVEGERLLRLAHERALAADDIEQAGRCLAALGIFLQVTHRHEEAEAALDSALALLDAEHPDAGAARLHLHAIRHGDNCGCHDASEPMTELLRRMIMDRMPPELVGDVEVQIDAENKLHLGIKSTREATEEETRQVQRAVRQAMEDLKRELGG